MKKFAVLIAGGSGTRLWPLSTPLKPKFFLPYSKKESIIQKHVANISKCGFERIIVVTSLAFEEDLKQSLKNIKTPIDYLCEPIPRNTGPSLFFAINYLKHFGSDSMFMVFPADHIISDYSEIKHLINLYEKKHSKYPIISLVKSAKKLSNKFGYLLGVKKGSGIFASTKFLEKPSLKKLSSLKKTSRLYINTGIFISSIDFFMNELSKIDPNFVRSLKKSIIKGGKTLSYENFSKVKSISIDKILMEKTKSHSFKILKSNWKDVGSFDSYVDFIDQELSDSEGNYLISSNSVVKDSSDNFFWSKDKFVSILGLNNIMCIENEGNILLANKNLLGKNNDFFEKVKKQYQKSTLKDNFSLRPWGWFLTLKEEPGYKVKQIMIFKGQSISLQSHKKRQETWTLVEGKGEVQVGKEIFKVSKGKTIKIPMNSKHRIKNVGKNNLVFIEVQLGSYLGEDDIIRYEDVYNRN